MFIKLRTRIHAELMCLACGLYLYLDLFLQARLRSCLFAKGDGGMSMHQPTSRLSVLVYVCLCMSPSWHLTPKRQ